MELREGLLDVWVVAVALLALKMIGVAQLIGIIRLLQGSFATVEDYELLRATFGPPPQGIPPVHNTPGLRRLGAIQRNDVENIPLFCILSAAYLATDPAVGEARILFSVYVVSRVMHTVLYALRSSPWRSIAFGVGVQVMLIMAGRVAAHVLPSASVTVQVVINAPILVHWVVGLITLSVVSEQRHRYDQLAQLQGVQVLEGNVGDA
ncbi:hypothetical protein AB1Y20_016081 [Prymnesium parvum]|uniref:Microsomal glutathione S-transferase 1 n=1 Tax=Prymnesium parvum TaxID=97485 RepID=A0AB34K2B9_PRYPA